MHPFFPRVPVAVSVSRCESARGTAADLSQWNTHPVCSWLSQHGADDLNPKSLPDICHPKHRAWLLHRWLRACFSRRDGRLC
jgi:hypothetical protein